MVNALAIMISAISIASAIGVANSDISAMEDKVVLIEVFSKYNFKCLGYWWSFLWALAVSHGIHSHQI